MTHGCLVQSGGKFYDPCACPRFTCDASVPLFSSFTQDCKIPFDPRSMVSDTIPLGGWRVSPLEVFDQAGFVQSILSTPNAVGNLPSGGDWRTEEGFLNTTGRYCDAFAGLWPDQTLPVGYHAIQGTGPSTLPLLSREEVASSRWSGSSTSMTSPASAVSAEDTQVGAGGVCRASNLGMPLIQTKQMRICTRQQVGADVLDSAVPNALLVGSFGQENCSTDSTDVL